MIVRKLIRVPAVLRIAAIHVDGAEYAVIDRHRNLMFEAVPRQSGVVRLDVDLDLLFEPMVLQETIDGVDIEIVLVFGGLVRLRLDQDQTLEADLVLVFHHQLDEPPS
jgi:hypothetical protein